MRTSAPALRCVPAPTATTGPETVRDAAAVLATVTRHRVAAGLLALVAFVAP